VELPEEVAAALEGEALEPAVEALERHLVRRALERHAGNITHAARALGLSRQGLLLKKKRYNLN
jgi:transcriptional regulator with PAS, ATPase and Fis domain